MEYCGSCNSLCFEKLSKTYKCSIEYIRGKKSRVCGLNVTTIEGVVQLELDSEGKPLKCESCLAKERRMKDAGTED